MTPEYVDASDLIQPDTRSDARKWLDAEMDKRWANDQGAEPFPILEAIALEVIEENQRLRAQIGQGVPDGWQLVPKNLTTSMLDAAAFSGIGYANLGAFSKAWTAALASAPQAPHPAFAFRECEDSQAGIEPQNSAAQEEPVKGEWVERWYGSKTDEGWSILFNSLVPRDKVAYLGTGVSAEAVQSIVYAHNQAISAPQQKPLTDEQDRAICEAYSNAASDEYFKARPQLDSDVNRRIFYAGYRRAWIEWQAAHNIGEKK